jgi:hypothetical protein
MSPPMSVVARQCWNWRRGNGEAMVDDFREQRCYQLVTRVTDHSQSTLVPRLWGQMSGRVRIAGARAIAAVSAAAPRP